MEAGVVGCGMIRALRRTGGARGRGTGRQGPDARAGPAQMRRRPAEGAGVGEGVIAGCSDCIVQSLHCAIRSRRWGARGAGQGV